MPLWNPANRKKLIEKLLSLSGFPHAEVPTVDEKQQAGTESKGGARINTNAPPSTPPETQGGGSSSSTARANLQINTNAPPSTPNSQVSASQVVGAPNNTNASRLTPDSGKSEKSPMYFSANSLSTNSPSSLSNFTPIMGGEDEMVSGDPLEPTVAKLTRANETRLYPLFAEDNKTVTDSFRSEILDLDRNYPWLDYVVSQMQRGTGHYYQLESGSIENIVRALKMYLILNDDLDLPEEDSELGHINGVPSKTLTPVPEDRSLNMTPKQEGRSLSATPSPSPGVSKEGTILSFLQGMSRSVTPSSNAASPTPPADKTAADKETDLDTKKDNRSSPKR